MLRLLTFFIPVFLFSAAADYLFLSNEEETAKVNAFDLTSYQIYPLKAYGRYYIDDPLDCLKSRIVADIVDEPDVLETLLKHVKEGMTVLDIGAHIGTFTIPIAKRLNGKGKLYAFEPQLKLFCELAHNLDLNQCQETLILHLALGNRNGPAQMHKPLHHNEGAGFIGGGGESIFIRTLDSLDLGRIDLIKIDVENSEYEILLGAEKTLRRDRPIILMEVGGNGKKRVLDRISRTRHHKRVIDKMTELGYTCAHVSWKNYLFTPQEIK